MFDDYDKNVNMLEGAYKKLKSYYYYDKSLLFIKRKIAYFENSEEVFHDTFVTLAKNLKCRNNAYFDSLIQQIGFVVLPKKMSSALQRTNVIRSNVDHTKNISKLNFYIDPPIELLILDTLWMLLIGKIQLENKCRSSNSYASQFKKSVFNGNNDFFTGIDFESNRCFEPYFKNYVAWRDNAFSIIEKEQNKTDLVLITLDLQSFYYSVNFDFENLSAILNNDARIEQFDILSGIIRKIYRQYTVLIRTYKKGIPDGEGCVFPIGLLSPMVLREAYMKPFDDMVVSSLKPNYYARYVDDILLVLSASDLDGFSKSDLIEHFLIANHIVAPSGKSGYKLVLYPTIKLQFQKINCFFFKKGTPNILLNIYKEQIQLNSSEANLLPDIDVLNTSFIGNAYTLFSDSGSTKIRDLQFLRSDNYSATRFVNSLKRILKNTVLDSSFINPFLDQILEFYSDSQGIEFSNNWRSVFELFTLCHDRIRANEFYINIKNYIGCLNFDLLEDDEIYARCYKKMLRQMKQNLQKSLDIAMSLAISLDYSMGRKNRLKEDAVIFRKSNLLNHQLVSIPLINYVSPVLQNAQSLINIDGILKNIGDQGWSQNFKLDELKLKFSPRFIHIEELYFSLFIFDFNSPKKRYINPHSLLRDKFCDINYLGSWANTAINYQKYVSNSVRFPSLFELHIKRKVDAKTRIGVVSTPVSEADALKAAKNSYECLTFEKKERLFRILNTAKREHARYLSFPEFYLPIAWLPEVWSFCKSNNIAVVTGLQYIVRGTQAYNFTCVIEPIIISKRYHSTLLCFREKLYYAPEEKKLLARLGYTTNDCEIPFYYIFLEPNFSFSTILCFEFTDICSRAALKGKIDALFVPQLNRDTNYFSSIVSATSRDLHCFIIQTNTSIYGDSRITGPFKTELKNILQIKGGTNDVVIIGEVDVQRLRDRQKNYEKEVLSEVQECLNCKKRLRNTSNDSCEICKKSNHHKRSNIKGTPPNFNRK